MAVEAFILAYQDGEPARLSFTEVLEAFGESVVGWDPQDGCLHLDFGGPDTCEVFADKDAAETGRVRGLLISRPIQAAGLWEPVLRILSRHHAVLFFSDDTTPRVWDPRSLKHFPEELIATLGRPVSVRTPADILGRKTC